MKTARSKPGRTWVVCVRNAGYEASLEVRKIYRALPDRAAAAEKMIRVIDESGEDYLYPAAWFEPIRLADKLRRALSSSGA